MRLLEKIEEFVEYCNEFYNNETGIYPIASSEDIEAAIEKYLKSKPLNEIEFDSIDREQVRTIIEPDYSMWIPE